MSGVGIHFRSAVTIVAGLTVASGAAAALIALMLDDIRVFTATFVIVTVVAVFLGLPLYWAARAERNDTSMVAAVMGFVVGAAIPAFLVFAGTADQASVGDTATVIDGRYTLAGWLQNLRFVGLFGLLGMGVALLFWFFVRRSASSDEQEAGSPPPPPLLRTAMLSVAAAGIVAAAMVIPYATADRSCHNTLRDGRDSIGPIASFDLRVGIEEWRNIEAEMANFQRSGAWSVRSDVRTEESFPWLQISLCKEPGTDIFVQGMAEFHEVNFSVYQPQGGASWRREFLPLYKRINTRWPAKVVFKDGKGQQTSTPKWATAENPK